jgi:hypothetical protein
MGAVASGHHPLSLPQKLLAFLSLFLPPRLPFLLVLLGVGIIIFLFSVDV